MMMMLKPSNLPPYQSLMQIGLIVWSLWIIPTVAQAQNPPSVPPTGGDRHPMPHSDLDPTPFTAESIGLTINLPLGAAVKTEKINNRLVVLVSDSHTSPTWSMRLQPLPATRNLFEPADEIADMLEKLGASKQTYKLLANQTVSIGSVVGQLCYLERTNFEDQKYISGWLVLPNGRDTFMVCSIQTLPDTLPRLQPLLDASFATIQLRSADELALHRQSRLETGRAFIESITPDHLKSLVGLSQWHRIYAPPSPDGKPGAERGYSLMEVVNAKKGALNPGRDEKTYSSDEQKNGLLVRVQGRVVINAQRGVYYDSIALYWMTWDQSEEAWSIRGTQRQGEAEQSEAETGARLAYAGPPSPLPTLTVIKSDNATNSREPFEWDVPEVYLSQAMGWLLGRLLPRGEVTAEREYGYYFYNFANAQPQISQRIDVWSPVNDGSGNFKLVTQLSSDSPRITSLYDKDGNLLRRVHADGSITEPATLDELRKLWKSKGLQVGPSGN